MDKNLKQFYYGYDIGQNINFFPITYLRKISIWPFKSERKIIKWEF